jgi:eukaryotic-like serine/threonine-protein kinase
MVAPRDNRAAQCPAEDQLLRVAQGIATATEESALALHLDICDGCRRRFEAFLATTEEQDALGRIRHEDEDGDLSAIAASAVPTLNANDDRGNENRLPVGLCLDPPREPGLLGSVGDFDIVSLLGEGGMGVVLRAVDRSLGRDVALKLMSNRLIQDPIARRRFLQEARSAAQLNHPNIVSVHSVDQHHEIPYIVMEFVAGTSLAHVMSAERRLQPNRAVGIARQVLEALEHAHQAGIIHRDVKPANILLDGGTDRVKLADFGIARGIADSTQLTVVGSVVGTPWYMAPVRPRSWPRFVTAILPIPLVKIPRSHGPLRTSSCTRSRETPSGVSSRRPSSRGHWRRSRNP